MKTRPFGFEMLAGECQTDPYDSHIERRLSSLSGQFANQSAYEDMLRNGDPVVYEVRAMERPEQEGELSFGLSIVHPGRVGRRVLHDQGPFSQRARYGRSLPLPAGPRSDADGKRRRRLGDLRSSGRGAGLRHARLGLLLHQFSPKTGGPGHVFRLPQPRWDTITQPSNRRGFRKLILREAGGYRLADNPRWSQAGAECHV